eukprot:6177955-Pleurochrysis_carterae.AAC.2
MSPANEITALTLSKHGTVCTMRWSYKRTISQRPGCLDSRLRCLPPQTSVQSAPDKRDIAHAGGGG